ncbi:MAG: hypothetical protein GX660_07860 [Clostridiaceae bacterium]|nr:hypothetical protein [Clostridiaceae bacterium]
MKKKYKRKKNLSKNIRSNKKSMKKKDLILLGIIAVVVVLAFIGINSFYPTRQKVMYGKYYDINQSEFNEEVSFSFNPQTYAGLQEGKGTMVNIPFFEAHGSKMMFEKITHNYGAYNVYINNATNWNFMSGSALSIWRMSMDNGVRDFFSVSPSIEAYNEKNETLNFHVLRGGVDESFTLEFTEEEFRNSKAIIVKMKGFYLNNYKFSFR